MKIFLDKSSTKDISLFTKTMTERTDPNAFHKVSIIPMVIDQFDLVTTKLTRAIHWIGTFGNFPMFSIDSNPSFSLLTKNLLSIPIITQPTPLQVFRPINRVCSIPSLTVGIVTILTDSQLSIIRLKELTALGTDRQLMSPSKEIAKKIFKCIV